MMILKKQYISTNLTNILGPKPTVEMNVFENYAFPILIPQNNKSGEPELNKIGEKCQDKNGFILHNTLSDLRQN